MDKIESGSGMNVLSGVLAGLGEEFACDRISILEEVGKIQLRILCEWHKPDLDPMSMTRTSAVHMGYSLQIDAAKDLQEGHLLSIHDIDMLKETEPDLYAMLLERGTKTALLAGIPSAEGRSWLLLLENPGQEALSSAGIMLPGIQCVLTPLLRMLQKEQGIFDGADRLRGDACMKNDFMYTRDTFFDHGDELLKQHMGSPVMMIALDVNFFTVYNDVYGREAGNEVLRILAVDMQEAAQRHHGIAGYMGGDDFVLLLPVDAQSREEVSLCAEEIHRMLHYPDGFSPVMGIYFANADEKSASKMYDLAMFALHEIKGNYLEHYQIYDERHFAKNRDEVMMLLQVRDGLANGEFTFYLQPQVHERTGRIVGAEALVRWEHDGQIIPPGKFIPALERSGHIFSLDRYIWEQVAAWIRDAQTRGLPSVPISVNVSRLDFDQADIAQHFIDLVHRYDLDPSLLGIEITESTFPDNLDMILDAIARLHEAGFQIYMDDFGSGSSSLSMLHNFNLDVLKIDVKFMSRRNADRKAVSIIESVITMAHMIDMKVVTEGVETEEQRNNLLAIGDNYAQGFYFYKPMPVREFEHLIADADKLGEPFNHIHQKDAAHLKLREMIYDGMVSDTLLDSILGPAAIIRQEGTKISFVQINDKFREVMDSYKSDSRYQQLLPDSGSVESILQNADKNLLSGTMQTFRLVDQVSKAAVELLCRVFLLYSCDTYQIYLGTIQ